MRYVIFEKNPLSNLYAVKRSNDEELRTIVMVFEEGHSFATSLKSSLLDETSTGLDANNVQVSIEDDIVILEPQYADKPEEYQGIIDRQKLLKLIDDWKLVVQTKPPFIVITEEDNEFEVIPLQEDIFVKAEKRDRHASANELIDKIKKKQSV